MWAGGVPQPEGGRRILTNLLLITIGLVGLIYGAELVVRGGVGVAREMGVPEVVVGLTLIAVGTSLPELVATLAAVRRKNIGLAVGGVVGSNIFNTLLITGVASTIRPDANPGVEGTWISGPPRFYLCHCSLLRELTTNGSFATRALALLAHVGHLRGFSERLALGQ